MIPFSLLRHVASAFTTLFGYPRTIIGEVGGRLLR